MFKFKKLIIASVFSFLFILGLATPALATLTLSNNGIIGDSSFNNLTIPGITIAGTQCLHINASGLISGTGTDCGSGGGGGVWGSISGTLANQIDLNTALNAKQATIGFTPENLANKSLNISTDGTSDLKYPSVKAVKDYADGLILGLLNYRGGYIASGNVYPTTGGSGAGGAIMKGDTFVISVAGSLGGVPIQVGDSIIANINNPTTTANWNTLNTNISYVPEDSVNKVTTLSSPTDTQYPSALLLFNQLALKQNNLNITTNGTSGPATLAGSTLNIPQYTAGTGTLTAVSIATANGFAGSSSGGATPALTISTSITGLLKGNGVGMSAAVAGTDYQLPITITAMGSSGAATLVGSTLNIPQYSGGGASPLTTKGDLFTFSTLGIRLPVGTDGQVLSSDSTQPTGLKWIAPASGGAGNPGGVSGQVQVNTGGAFAGQASSLNGGLSAVFQSAIECAKGTISIAGGNWNTPAGAVPATATTLQDIPIITGLTGDERYTSVLISESTIFTSASITGTKISIGRPGASTDDEMLPQTSFMQSSGNSWFAEDRPQSPVLGSGNAYSLVLAVRTIGGNVSALTGGAVNYEVCGYKTQ